MTTNLRIGAGKKQLEPLDAQTKSEKTAQKLAKNRDGKAPPKTKGENQAAIIGAISGMDGKFGIIQETLSDLNGRCKTILRINKELEKPFVISQNLVAIHNLHAKVLEFTDVIETWRKVAYQLSLNMQ